MSILASAGRAKIYNTDGTGRDTYVSFNSGGFTGMKTPAAAQQPGTFGQTMRVSAQHIARGGGLGSPGKTIHYQVNGTGRDSYIHANHGGFSSNYQFQNDRDRYVQSLRGYPNTSSVTAARSLNTRSPRQSRDPFVEGQVNNLSPRAKQSMHELKTYQKSQVQRLAQPKRNSLAISVNQLEQVRRSSANLREDSPRSHFLRKTSHAAGFGMQRSPSQGSSGSGHARKELVMGGASLKEHLAAQLSSPRVPPLNMSRNNIEIPQQAQGLNMTARSNRNSNNLLIDQIASARQSMKMEARDNGNNMVSETPTPSTQNKVVNRIGNKRRMLALGDPDELTGVRITDGQAHDRYERKKGARNF